MSNNTTIVLTPTTPPTIPVISTTHVPRTTVSDIVEHLRDYLGSNVNAEVQRAILRSLQSAYRELTNARRWVYLYQHGRVQVRGHYTTGSVAYSTSTNQMVLTGGTWPSWVDHSSQIAIGTVTYQVAQRISDTVVTLDPVLTSIADIPSGTAFDLYQDTYDLPLDYVAQDQSFADVAWAGLEYVHVNAWLQVTRFYRSFSNTPRYWTIRGSPKTPGRMAISLFPYPDQDRTLDFIYHRRPRTINLYRYETGTVSVDSVGQPTTITGSGTAWDTSMIGSTIRLSSSTTQPPTSFAGVNPYAVECNIVNVTGAGTIITDQSIPTSYTGVKYVISDPIDIEVGAMMEAFLRCCEKHVSIQRNKKDVPVAEKLSLDALIRAEEADSRSFQGRVAGQSHRWRQRFAFMPMGSDIS